MEKISVIMPCYNAGSHLAQGVASALGQSYQNIELIVVDDGSTDRSPEILAGITDPRLKVIAQPNRGVSAARNRGLAEATGVLVAFLDTDDTWRADCLELLHAALERAPEAAVAYCGWQNVGLAGGRGEPFIPPDYEAEGKLEHLLRCCPWPIHAALTRRSAIVAAGGFDERYSHAEDYALWLEISSVSKIVMVPQVLAFYNFHGAEQATCNVLQVVLSQYNVQREYLECNPGVFQSLGGRTIRSIVYGELRRQGFTFYWQGDLESARQIFRKIMIAGYGSFSDWRYMIPSVLPVEFHRRLIRLLGSRQPV